MTVGLNIQALRKQRGLTLEELSVLCGLNRDDLGAYERGAMTPRPDTVRRLAQALEVPIAAVRHGLGWTAPQPSEDWETAGDDALLRSGVEQVLREQGDFPYDEGEVAALMASVKAAIPALVEHMKDTRDQAVIHRELLQELKLLPEPAEEALVRRCALSDQQWEQVRDLLPDEKAGRGRAFKSNRLMLDGIVYRLRTGCAWTELPACFGRPKCVSDRLRLWTSTGVWDPVQARLTELGVL